MKATNLLLKSLILSRQREIMTVIRNKKHDIFDKCRRAYLCEKRAYEQLITNFKFNSIYIDQESVFGRFIIGNHYHALGPFLILKYLDKTLFHAMKKPMKKLKNN